MKTEKKFYTEACKEAIEMDKLCHNLNLSKICDEQCKARIMEKSLSAYNQITRLPNSLKRERFEKMQKIALWFAEELPADITIEISDEIYGRISFLTDMIVINQSHKEALKLLIDSANDFLIEVVNDSNIVLDKEGNVKSPNLMRWTLTFELFDEIK